MSLKVVENTTKNTLNIIYDEIYTKLNEQYIDIFLCGGASTKSRISTRDSLREKLNNLKGVRVLYPEDLFIDMLQRNKDHNLLSLEKFLADNCDFIFIVCESAGSLVELGAFTNNNETVDKVIAIMEEKYKKQKSFIMLGPIKMLNKINKNRVVYYRKDDVENLNLKMKILLGRKGIEGLRNKIENNKKPLDTIIGLYYFIPLLLYFYKDLESDRIVNYLKYLFKEKGFNLKEFKTLFISSLQLLHKDKSINKKVHNNKSYYSLTSKGYENVNKVLYNINIDNRNILYDRVRFDIIKNSYY